MAATLLLDAADASSSAAPERRDVHEPAHDRLARGLLWRARRLLRPSLPRLRALAAQAEALAADLAGQEDAALRARLHGLAPEAVRAGRAEGLAEPLALVAEGAWRALGVRPYPTQLMGAAVLLEGRLAEMQTGEGKTLTAALAACVAAAAGLPTHVITVNDYLARRDAGEMGPLFAFFGLGVGVVDSTTEQADKPAAYARAVCYCSNKVLVFDYLRDRIALQGRASTAQLLARDLHGTAAQASGRMLRGLHYAIVDEADSVLIDEARTPLILSARSGAPPDAEVYRQALALAAQLRQPEHFELDPGRRELQLRPAGKEQVRQLSLALGGVWMAARAREHLAGQALRALHLFLRDQHYLLLDGKVQIVDEYTGRVLDGRSWELGLHQMIECKEGVALTEPARTLARITYQRFFARYLRLSGMTGTAAEVAPELNAVYRLDAVTLPTHRPSQRLLQPPLVLPQQLQKWQAVAERVAALHASGRPVLVGTRSVQASETLGALLAERRLVHRLLNARQDAEEAQIIAGAGQAGAITVATNMAGRGTDIHLGPGVAERGGLVVILTEFHESARIDRQLIGRGARQGDPGEAQAIVALDDPLFCDHAGRWRALLAGQGLPSARRLEVLRRWAQRRAGRIHAAMRKQTLAADRQMDQMLGFTGNTI